MKYISKNQDGFSVLELILIVVIMSLIGGVGFYVYKSRQNTQTPVVSSPTQTTTSNTKTVTPEKKAINTLALASGTVKMDLPAGWTTAGSACSAPAYSSLKLVGSTVITPGEKLPTIYGNGTEYFGIDVCVFENPSNLTAEKWFTTDFRGSAPVGNDVVARADINGNNAYYYKQVVSNEGYHEMNYVINAKGKIVYVRARTYETAKDKPGVGDFTKFESAITTAVNSTTVN